MADELDDLFVSIRDENGNVTGIMDRMTADYLTSKAPNPTQLSIDTLLRTITRIRVVPIDNFYQGATKQKVLLESSGPKSLASFRECFAINEDPNTFGHCMCLGDPHIELYSGDKLVATFGYHHGFSIRWSAWKHDAHLKEPQRLLDWMSDHGVDGPRQEVESSIRQAEESRRHQENWLKAMPECFQPFWDQMGYGHTSALYSSLVDAFQLAYPDPENQVLTLFAWYGSGAGPWSGFPAYESVPESLLREYPTPFLVSVIQTSQLTDTQWLGAARYFGGYHFNKSKREDQKLLPLELKHRLLNAARSTGIADNIQRAERAFRT